jgi:predicted MPP superfamily phosphohydrolase
VKNPKRFLWFCIKLTLLMALMWWFLYWENNALKLSVDEVYFQELPAALDGLRIIHLSDLHSKWFGNDQQRLVRMIEKKNPQAIVITGDAVDAHRKDEQPALTLISHISAIAPVLYVTGNHETQLQDREGYLERVRKSGAQVLMNESVVIPFDGGVISFAGMADHGQRSVSLKKIDTTAQEALAEAKPGSFTILLSHRPELFSYYAKLPVNLIFAGHAHGGQIRLPWIGGLYAPGQGFLPKYDSGAYRNDETGQVMIVSRGLGNSEFPQRIFNRPDVRLVILKKEQRKESNSK